jgi:hypothetical protein
MHSDEGFSKRYNMKAILGKDCKFRTTTTPFYSPYLGLTSSIVVLDNSIAVWLNIGRLWLMYVFDQLRRGGNFSSQDR